MDHFNKNIKILLVEDNPGDVRLIKEMIIANDNEREGIVRGHNNTIIFELECFSRVSELNSITHNKIAAIDIVLLDLSLPDSQGINTFNSVFELFPHIPIILLTALDDEDLALKAVKKGAQDYLMKGDVNRKVLIKSIRYAIERKQIDEERKKLIKELKEAFLKIKQLKGLLPICASCKKIRDDKGQWKQIEKYIREHSDADFTHSFCPECAKKLYPSKDR